MNFASTTEEVLFYFLGGGGGLIRDFRILLTYLQKTTVVPELMKISHFFSYLSDSKDQTIIEKVLLANDRGN